MLFIHNHNRQICRFPKSGMFHWHQRYKHFLVAWDCQCNLPRWPIQYEKKSCIEVCFRVSKDGLQSFRCFWWRSLLLWSICPFQLQRLQCHQLSCRWKGWPPCKRGLPSWRWVLWTSHSGGKLIVNIESESYSLFSRTSKMTWTS